MTETAIRKDPQSRTMKLEAEFDASPEVPSVEGIAPFQIAFVVGDLERAAGEFDARLAAGPWRGWIFGLQGRSRASTPPGPRETAQPLPTTGQRRSVSSSRPSSRPPSATGGLHAVDQHQHGPTLRDTALIG